MDILDQASFAEQLRGYRLAAGLTQTELADRSSLSVRAISDLERGMKRAPRPHTITQLARALRLSRTQTALLAHSVSRRRGPRGASPKVDPLSTVGP
jgi:transcriptional regulator with XRE-family HTH domain